MLFIYYRAGHEPGVFSEDRADNYRKRWKSLSGLLIMLLLYLSLFRYKNRADTNTETVHHVHPGNIGLEVWKEILAIKA